LGEYFLKNPTASTKTVDDLGIVISAGQSITIDENDFDGYLTQDMVAALAAGLVLSTTDIGSTLGDFPNDIAIERLTLKSHWKPAVATVGDLPVLGNESGDVRLTLDKGILYAWDQLTVQWDKVTSNFSLTVEEYDGSPSGSEIQKLVFVEAEDDVYIDADNKIAYIGPPDAPLSLNGANLVTAGTSFFTGKVSVGNINYKPSDPAGTTVSYITNDGVFTVSTPSGNYSDQGEKGIISVYLNDVVIAKIDLGANFNEALRDSNQNIAAYNVAGAGDLPTAGKVTFSNGSFEILSVGKFNGFKFYQTWASRLNITNSLFFRQGWNEIYITHSGLSSGTQTSTKLNVFLDTDIGPNPVVTTVTATQKTPVYRYLSGVKYYDSPSTWDIDFTLQNGFDNAYPSNNSPATLSGWPGMTPTDIVFSDSSVSGVSNPPVVNEVMTVNNWQLIQTAGQMNPDARLTITPKDVYGVYASSLTPSQNIMVYSMAPVSTPLKEYFRDEVYRLPHGNYTTVPVSITGQWDSTQSLATYDSGDHLQLFMDDLIFPHQDFTNTLPSGNPNYLLLAAQTNKYYFRAFKSTTLSRAQGTLRLTGVSKLQMANKDIRVWIKVPSQTGWLSLNDGYNYATFTGADNDGCWMDQLSQTNSDFVFGLDRFRTEFGGYMIIVKIMIPSNSGIVVSHAEILDW
jgi:hypothetical protein